MKTVIVGCLCAAALLGVGCGDGRGVPTSPGTIAAGSSSAATQGTARQPVDVSLSASPRSGALQVTKECSNTEPVCTITASNLEAIELGSRITYLQPTGLATPSGSDVVLDLPGPGNNAATGHCTLDPRNNYFGRCTFSGGTGKFTWFHASVAVTHNAEVTLWYWEGTYSFSPQD